MKKVKSDQKKAPKGLLSLLCNGASATARFNPGPPRHYEINVNLTITSSGDWSKAKELPPELLGMVIASQFMNAADKLKISLDEGPGLD